MATISGIKKGAEEFQNFSEDQQATLCSFITQACERTANEPVGLLVTNREVTKLQETDKDRSR